MKENKLIIPTQRLEALADAVFAIAMTLLVLNIAMPEVSQAAADKILPKRLLELLPSFYNFTLSFLLLGIFWIIHHKQYLSISKSTGVLAWINLFLLMFVVLVPFTTELVDTYSNIMIAAILFNSNVFIISVIFFIQYKYAINQHLIDYKLSQSHIELALKKNMVIIPIAVVAMVIAVFKPSYSTLTYILIPFIIKYLENKFNQNKLKEK